MILNIVNAGGGSIILPLKLYGLKISARIFNQITPVEFMKIDLGCARRIPMGIFLYQGGVPFQQNMFCEPRNAPLLADLNGHRCIKNPHKRIIHWNGVYLRKNGEY